MSEAINPPSSGQATDEMALITGPGALGSPAPSVGSDIWQMTAESFNDLVRRAVNGELLNMEGDL